MPLRPHILLVAPLLLITERAVSHPHVFIDTTATFLVVADTRLAGLHISWTYDEFTSLWLLEELDLDADGDGQFDSADLSAIVRSELQWPEWYNGNVFLDVNGITQQLEPPTKPILSSKDHRITLAFDLVHGAPVPLSASTARVRVYDPEFYYGFTLRPTAPSPALPSDCRQTFNPFAEDASTRALRAELAVLGADETPTQADVGRRFADELHLTCR